MQALQPENSQQVTNLKTASGSFGEFTRRKNWSQSILDSMRDVVHVLSKDLLILYCSDASSEILGYRSTELVGHLFTEFLHVDDVDVFVREFKNIQNTAQTFRTCYRFLRKDGKYATLETRGQFYKTSFFGNARRIPTEAAQSIDTLLDLKMENEILKKRLAAVKLEHQNKKKADSTQNKETPLPKASESNEEEEGEEAYDVYMPTEPSNSSLVYTQGVSPSYGVAESLSLFTGLRYDLGERSHGISMGLQGGELTDAGQNPSMDFNDLNVEKRLQRDKQEEPKSKKKRANSRLASSNVCTDCGTTESPEWRKGPNGPKTLCNACGLRWSKKQKSEQQE
ncbi:hypothetical protein G6F66_008091 [Rhizopus arrhizus]|nr:hypothetical protein G6F66_008091 [Rhizopus arrhizus]